MCARICVLLFLCCGLLVFAMIYIVISIACISLDCFFKTRMKLNLFIQRRKKTLFMEV